MDILVIPVISSEHVKSRAKDELPQSATGRRTSNVNSKNRIRIHPIRKHSPISNSSNSRRRKSNKEKSNEKHIT